MLAVTHQSTKKYFKRKQVRGSNKSIWENNTFRSLDLLQIDLMHLMHIESIGDKKYVLVIVVDFNIYTNVS